MAGVGDQAREQYKRDAVIEALKIAVEKGLAVQFNEDELKELFMEVIREIFDAKGGR